jgi:hypothetical protein
MASNATSHEPKQNWWVLGGFISLLLLIVLGGTAYIGAQRAREMMLRGIVAQELIVIGTMRLGHQSSGQPPYENISEELISDITDICHKNKEFLLEVRVTDVSKSYLVHDFLGMCESLELGISRGDLINSKVFDAARLMSKAVGASISSDDGHRIKKDLE